FSLAGKEPAAAPLVSQNAKPPAATTAKATPPGELPDAAGKATVEKVCSDCHGVSTFASNRMSREEWQGVVGDMVARGATATEAELRTVVDYLAKNLGK